MSQINSESIKVKKVNRVKRLPYVPMYVTTTSYVLCL